MTTLTLTVLRCPDSVSAGQRQLQGGELTVGRGVECGWPLSDPLKSLSRKHCTLEYFAGSWQVRDLSANGTFVNFATAPIGHDLAQPLRDGDRLRLGDYEIEVRIDEAMPAVSGRLGPTGLDLAVSPFGDAPRPGFSAARRPGLDDWVEDSGRFGPSSRDDRAIPDHAASSSDAFVPPPIMPTGKAIIPDDWYREIGRVNAPPAAQPLARRV